MKEAGRSKHSTSRKLFDSSKGKKRRRAVASDSESSDNSSEPVRQRVDKLNNGSTGCKEACVEDREMKTEKRESNGLDVFEFDEYDGFDDSMIRKNASNSKHRWNLNGTATPTNGTTSRLEIEDDESDLPLSVLTQKYRSSLNNSVRLQGKNGDLKVTVNKNKQTSVSHKTHDKTAAKDQKEDNTRDLHKKKVHVSEDSTKNKSGIKSSLNSNSKPAVSKKSKEPLKPNSKGEVANSESSVKTPVKMPVKKVTQVKGKEEIKVNHGSASEKQILREKIKDMILDAGWTIDYRPRRGRDYHDSVYISPSGTAYWSIVKAYDAFKKEEEENSEDGGNFTPLPNEILDKLTRQTRKRIEREMKNKRKNEDSDQKEEKPKRRRKSKKNKFDDESEESEDDSSENSDEEKPEKISNTNSKKRKSKNIGRCTLLVRGSDTGVNSENDKFVAYSGKRTILSWLINSGIVNISENVEYMNSRKTRVMQKGRITKDGILCGCCSKIVTVSKFEAHSGNKLQQPFLNIFLPSGKSLMQCQIDAWNKQGDLERKGFYNVDDDGDDPNDDTCSLCGDGGDLICCDSCPSTFHQSCLEIQMLPQGDWHCPNCICKYCEVAGDDIEDSILTCCFCQKKYHESCRPEKEAKAIESDHMNQSFCGHTCHELYSQLQKLFGVKHELDSGFSWTLIHRSDISTDESSSLELSQKVESNSMLAVAMSIMEECFLPVTDRRSGANLIRNVVFNCGSNLSRLNYSGFFTAILEKGDEVVAAASIRIHGRQLAEMPFIGTRHMYRRQGMCRRLLSAIETALLSLEVKKLIIPAVAERMHTWTDVFGFKAVEESHKQEMKSMNMLVFPKTDMLQKPLVKKATPNAIPKGEKTIEVYNRKPLSKRSKLISSKVKELSEKTESGSQESNVPLDDTCSIDAKKETLPVNSPFKDDVAVSENKSELVSSLSGEIEDPITKTADADSHDNNNTTVSSDSPHESKVEDSVVEVANEITPETTSDIISPEVPCGTKLQPPETESVSVFSHSDPDPDPNVEEKEIGVQNGDANPSQGNTVPCVEEVEMDVKNGCETTTNNTTDVNSVEPEEAPNENVVSSDTPCEHESADVTLVTLEAGEHDVNSLESKAPNENIVSSDTPCEHESAHVTPVVLETGENDVIDDNIQSSGGKEASSETQTAIESNAHEKEKAVSDTDALKSASVETT